MALAADWLRPIYEAIRTGVMVGGYVQVDETPIRYLAPGHGQTRQSYLWAYSRPGGDVLFDWKTSRAILTRLPTATNWQVKDLTPEAWAKTRQPNAWQAVS